jgi:hypothetical protein
MWCSITTNLKISQIYVFSVSCKKKLARQVQLQGVRTFGRLHQLARTEKRFFTGGQQFARCACQGEDVVGYRWCQRDRTNCFLQPLKYQ